MISFYDLRREVLRDRGALIEAFEEVLDSGWYIMGSKLDSFEKEFAEFVGAKYAIGVGNGLEALMISLAANEIGPGDEVIVPAHTFVATWIAVSKVGATLVPVDVDEGNCLIDIDEVSKAITSKTRAIVPVHLFGNPVDVPALRKAVGDDIAILEDAAQAHGASIDGVMAGNLGDTNSFSFYPAKTLGALGDAGAITTNNPDHYQKICALRNYGSTQKYVHDIIGTNSRLDEMQAAFLSIKLRRLLETVTERNKIADIYDRALAGVDRVEIPPPPTDGTVHARHLYVVRVPNRDAVVARLLELGVQAQIHYPIAPFDQAAYSDLGLTGSNFPNASKWAKEAISLPMTPQMDENEILKVVEHLNTVLNK